MPKSHPAYPAAFREQILELVRAGVPFVDGVRRERYEETIEEAREESAA